jgi:hypothetical protein
LLQFMSLPFRASIILSKLVSIGRRIRLGSHVSDFVAFRDPLESHLLSPVPVFSSLAGPNCGRFAPVHFCP